MEGENEVVGLRVAPNVSVACQCGMNYCVGVMTAPGSANQGFLPPLTLPIPPYNPTLPPIPHNHFIRNTDVRKGWKKP